MTTDIPQSHPRYVSLKTRELLEVGVKNGITSLGGLIAHGRGEAFDYLLGEKTQPFAKRAITAAATVLLQASHPVISVNGNSTILSAKELIQLATLLDAPLEINLFHSSKERERKIRNHLMVRGAKKVLMPNKHYAMPSLLSNRRFVNSEGIWKADIIFVPLEDGDRAQALIKNGKKVITIDLNPLSRTAKTSTITIVDNIVRALPLLIQAVKKRKKGSVLQKEVYFNNEENLKQAIAVIQKLRK